MVSFRRCILALTVLALFAGFANAQLLQCGANVSVTPNLRSEGYTEQTGDITISCTGGVVLAPGSLIPQVNIQIFLNTAVTSRLTPVSGVSNNISDALLLIDEPGSGLAQGSFPAGFGPGAPQTVCGAAGTLGSSLISGTTISTTAGDATKGCIAYVGTTGTATGQSVGSCTTAVGGACTVAASTPAANIYQGIVQGNSVTFFGVPVLPPGTTSSGRTFRVSNIRANATSLSGGSAAGATPVIASISLSGAATLLLQNPTPTIGFVQSGLSTTVGAATNQNQCSSANRAALAILTFNENFGSAFKTRVAAATNTSYAGQVGNPVQNAPGTIYNSESNLVIAIPTSATPAGLADYGTRLKAQFSNVPAGIRLFVSTTNINNQAIAVTAPTVIGGSAGNTAATGPFAQLVTSETVNDGNLSGFFPGVSSTDVPSTGNTPIVEIPVVNGTATAVWEVVNTNPNQLDSIKFGVYSTYTSNVAQNSPPAGTATVNLSFAPTPTAAFSAASAAAASSTLTIPRFIADTGAARNLLNINICRTILLYPYVTNVQGFDTGLAIANTSTDPFGTGAQAGVCKLNWYQGVANPAQGDTGVIASGTVYTALTSTAAPGFSGYMIAVCNFQYAHGFAFISDLGARNLAMGYLALVIPDPGTGSRNAAPGGCNGVSGCANTGESDSH